MINMKITTMYLLLVLAWFFAGLPISIIVFLYATNELKKVNTKNEIIAIRIAQALSLILAVLMIVYLVK